MKTLAFAAALYSNSFQALKGGREQIMNSENNSLTLPSSKSLRHPIFKRIVHHEELILTPEESGASHLRLWKGTVALPFR